MDEKTREALEIVNDLSSYGCLDSSDERDRKEALAHLQAMVEDCVTLKKKLGRSNGAWLDEKERRETAEAELKERDTAYKEK